jgi:hypothetical protein
MSNRRQDRAIASLEKNGVYLQNSKPDNGPRRWFHGPTSPTIKGIRELEMVAAYVDIAALVWGSDEHEIS